MDSGQENLNEKNKQYSFPASLLKIQKNTKKIQKKSGKYLIKK